MSEWKPYPIEAIGKIVTGKTPPSRVTDAFLEVGVPFVTPRDMDGRRWKSSTERYLSEDGVQAVKNSLVPANSVAVSCIGSDMGKAVLLVSESVTNQQINTIIVNEDLFNPKFIYYVLSTKQQELKDISGGSATPILNKGHFGKFEILAPQKPCQDLIVEQLDSLDSKIELNRQTNQTLEHIAQAIFKSWFVDFEPTRAKAQVRASVAEGKMPGSDQNLPPGFSKEDEERLVERAAMAAISGKSLDELDAQGCTNAAGAASAGAASTDYLAQLRTTAALFPDMLVESELGEIPEGWEVACAADVCNFQNGYAFKSKEMSKSPIDTYKVFKMGHIKKGGGLNQAGTRDYYDKDKCEKLGRYLIKKGDLLMCMTDMKNNVALLGHTALMDVDDEYILNQRVGLLRSKDVKRANYPYLYILTNSETFIDDLRSRANSGVQVNLSTKEIKDTKFILPSELVHVAFDAIVERAQETIFSLEAEQEFLAELRDLLLPKLLSGELPIITDKAAVC